MSGTAQSGTFFGAPQGSMPVESHLTCLARTFTAYERRTYSALVAKFVQNGKLREPRWLGLSLIGSTGLVEIKKHRWEITGAIKEEALQRWFNLVLPIDLKELFTLAWRNRVFRLYDGPCGPKQLHLSDKLLVNVKNPVSVLGKVNCYDLNKLVTIYEQEGS